MVVLPAKSIRRYESDIAKDLFKTLAKDSPDAAEKYTANLERYEKEGEEIQNEARKLEDESHLRGRQALRFHAGEVFLEIGIVLASLAILTKRRLAWSAAILSAVIGIGVAASYLSIQ